MITEQDLREAIAECEGQRNPTANTCVKLAAFYTIKDKMYPSESLQAVAPTYSYAPAREQYAYESETEFMQAIKDMDINDVLAVVDETMTALSVYNPRLYSAVLRKLEN